MNQWQSNSEFMLIIFIIYHTRVLFYVPFIGRVGRAERPSAVSAVVTKVELDKTEKEKNKISHILYHGLMLIIE